MNNRIGIAALAFPDLGVVLQVTGFYGSLLNAHKVILGEMKRDREISFY